LFSDDIWLTVALTVALPALKNIVVRRWTDSAWRVATTEFAIAFHFGQSISPKARRTVFTIEARCVVDAPATFSADGIALSNSIWVGVLITVAFLARKSIGRVTEELLGTDFTFSSGVTLRAFGTESVTVIH
jgi:hypothetical protein